MAPFKQRYLRLRIYRPMLVEHVTSWPRTRNTFAVSTTRPLPAFFLSVERQLFSLAYEDYRQYRIIGCLANQRGFTTIARVLGKVDEATIEREDTFREISGDRTYTMCNIRGWRFPPCVCVFLLFQWPCWRTEREYRNDDFVIIELHARYLPPRRSVASNLHEIAGSFLQPVLKSIFVQSTLW